MKTKMYTPSPALRPFINRFMVMDIDWTQTLTGLSVWRVIPYGKVSMLLLYGHPHEYSLSGPQDHMQKTGHAFLMGHSL